MEEGAVSADGGLIVSDGSLHFLPQKPHLPACGARVLACRFGLLLFKERKSPLCDPLA